MWVTVVCAVSDVLPTASGLSTSAALTNNGPVVASVVKSAYQSALELDEPQTLTTRPGDEILTEEWRVKMLKSLEM